MSEIFASIQLLNDVQHIEGADRIQTATIDGYPVVVNKDYNEGEKVVYFPGGLEIPTYVARGLGVESYLRKGRIVKTVRLKGYLSYGFAIGGLDIPDGNTFFGLNELPVGTNVDNFFGTRKYDPPVHPSAIRFGAVERGDARLFKFTDIGRLDKPRDVLHGEQIFITEKIHGTNVRIGMIDGQLMVGSRNLQRVEPLTDQEKLENWFWYPTLNENLTGFLKILSGQGHDVILFGETFGSGVWSNFTYNVNGLDFRAFDLMIDGQYQSPGVFFGYMQMYNIPTAPLLYYGVYDKNIVHTLAQSKKSMIFKGTFPEGIVIRTAEEKHHPREGRMIFKVLNGDFEVHKSAGKIDDATDN